MSKRKTHIHAFLPHLIRTDIIRIFFLYFHNGGKFARHTGHSCFTSIHCSKHSS